MTSVNTNYLNTNGRLYYILPYYNDNYGPMGSP